MKASIERRNFLLGFMSAGAALSLPSLPRKAFSASFAGRKLKMKVSKVEMLQITGKNRRKALYIRIKTNEGAEGLYGPIDKEAAMFVDRFFRRRLINKDPLAIESFWELMFRASRHSRGSHYIMGLSAVDNALWDLRGRVMGLPVYRLLGGSRNKVRAYASCLGLSQEPKAMQDKARELKKQGFKHQKWFIKSRGPKRGPEGVHKDVEVVRLLREAVGDDVDLMFDALWKWDMQYALAWARRAEKYFPRWIEEPFQTANLDAFIEFSRKTSIPVAAGEHFYTRYDVHKFLKNDAIMVVQADPEWCGGVSELIKICALASVHGVNVIPHGHNLHAAMHVVASQPVEVCPLVEYLLKKMKRNYYIEKHQIQVENGMITMPERPGFGIQFDESKIEDTRVMHWD